MPASKTSPVRACRTPTVTELPLRLEPVTPDPFNDDAVEERGSPDLDAHARQRARVLASLVAVPEASRPSTGRRDANRRAAP